MSGSVFCTVGLAAVHTAATCETDAFASPSKMRSPSDSAEVTTSSNLFVVEAGIASVVVVTCLGGEVGVDSTTVVPQPASARQNATGQAAEPARTAFTRW